jgi:hypothetical protein
MPQSIVVVVIRSFVCFRVLAHLDDDLWKVCEVSNDDSNIEASRRRSFENLQSGHCRFFASEGPSNAPNSLPARNVWAVLSPMDRLDVDRKLSAGASEQIITIIDQFSCIGFLL